MMPKAELKEIYGWIWDDGKQNRLREVYVQQL